MAASLCNPILRPPPTAVPAKNLISGGTIMRNASFIQRPPPHFFTGRTLSTPSTAIPAQKYEYPDPIPEFAEAETRRFKPELLKRLSKEKDTFGDDLQKVVSICAEIFGEFLHKDYGGPGTLLIEPFTDMMVALKEKNLPGAPLAARSSLLWAQNYVDRDWEDWNSKSHK